MLLRFRLLGKLERERLSPFAVGEARTAPEFAFSRTPFSHWFVAKWAFGGRLMLFFACFDAYSG